jgi:hypothetical protein
MGCRTNWRALNGLHRNHRLNWFCCLRRRI